MKTIRFLSTAICLAITFTMFFACSSDSPSGPSGSSSAYENDEFSVVPPKSWQVTNYSGLKYKIFIGQRENNFTPNINFIDEVYNGSLDDYVDLTIKSLKAYISNVEIIYQNSFVTDDNLESRKIIAITEQQGYLLRQSQYIFPGKNGLKMVATCTALASSGEMYDIIFDNSMKTFKWTK